MDNLIRCDLFFYPSIGPDIKSNFMKKERWSLKKIAEIDLKTGIIKTYNPNVCRKIKKAIKEMEKEFGVKWEYKKLTKTL